MQNHAGHEDFLPGPLARSLHQPAFPDPHAFSKLRPILA